MATSTAPTRSLAPEAVWAAVERGEAHILDLRTAAERRRYGAPPGAKPVSLAKHVSRPEGAGAVYLCQHAVRSKLTLRRGASEIDGGFVEWQKAGLPVQKGVPMLARTPIARPRLRAALGFVRHAVEMLLAMLVGMMVLGGLYRVVLAVADADVGTVQHDAPEVPALVMAFNMALPMALWMRYRGHARSRSVEMGAAMFAPGVIAVALMELALIEAGVVCGVECAVMIPAMFILMLYRREDYTHPHRELVEQKP